MTGVPDDIQHVILCREMHVYLLIYATTSMVFWLNHRKLLVGMITYIHTFDTMAIDYTCSISNVGLANIRQWKRPWISQMTVIYCW